jgi:hypothetical protein
MQFYFLPSFSPPVPDPAVVIMSTPVSPIRPVGSAVALICTVDLSPLVNVPLTVTTQISGPAGVAIIPPVTNSVMENTTRYTSTATVNSFGRNQSGEYTCIANVESNSNFLVIGGGVTGMDSITIGTGKLC